MVRLLSAMRVPRAHTGTFHARFFLLAMGHCGDDNADVLAHDWPATDSSCREAPPMPLQEGGTYRVPDGRLFKAEREIRQYGPTANSWTLVPLDIDKSAGHAWRDMLSRLLFLED